MFMSHDLRFPIVFNRKLIRLSLDTSPCSSHHLFVIYSRSICERSHDQTIPQITFATLWPVLSIPAFGPGMWHLSTWYRLILRKEDQIPTLYSSRYLCERPRVSLCGYSDPSSRSTTQGLMPSLLWLVWCVDILRKISNTNVILFIHLALSFLIVTLVALTHNMIVYVTCL